MLVDLPFSFGALLFLFLFFPFFPFFGMNPQMSHSLNSSKSNTSDRLTCSGHGIHAVAYLNLTARVRGENQVVNGTIQECRTGHPSVTRLTYNGTITDYHIKIVVYKDGDDARTTCRKDGSITRKSISVILFCRTPHGGMAEYKVFFVNNF